MSERRSAWVVSVPSVNVTRICETEEDAMANAVELDGVLPVGMEILVFPAKVLVRRSRPSEAR